MSLPITSRPFGTTPAGEAISLYTLRNANGVEARLCNYGGIIVNWFAPDRDGRCDDIVLGYDTLDAYVRKNPFFGCLVGRYANRIAQGRFSLDGREYQLAQNNFPNALHGGPRGFDKAVWDAEILTGPAGPTLRLSYLSKDGEECYPGNLRVAVDHTLAADNGLRLDFSATTDQPTVVCLTQHSYFNLACTGDVLGQQVQIDADRFTAIDRNFIPTGELRSVAGTPHDFRESASIGSRIDTDDEQLRLGLGYDHNWIVNRQPGGLALHARVVEPTTGRALEVFSTEPGLQFYSGNFLNGSIAGKNGRVYRCRSGFCLEPQHFPDSPNHPAFPSTVLRPGEQYSHTLIYRTTVG